MTFQRNFLEYHKSIAAELEASKNRIRNLIGDRHWQTDGEHKEAILRKVLRNHVAETLRLGTGFVCGPISTSHQIDILITTREKPTLFRDGELVLVTPDAVVCIIEVKTTVSSDLREILKKLSDDVEMIRTNGSPDCHAGLFIYETNQYSNNNNHLLYNLYCVANRNPHRVINWLAFGPNLFVRYWSRGRAEVGCPIEGPVWHSYNLQNLSHAYFLSNVVLDTCPNREKTMEYAWFPVEGGKENYRGWYISLDEGKPTRFSQT